MKAKLYKTNKGEYILLHPNKTIYENGSVLGFSRDVGDKTLQFENAHKLSKQNCDEIFVVVDVDIDKLADSFFEKESSNILHPQHQMRNFFILGFNKAMELNKEKMFTVDDVRNAMDWIMTQYFEFHEQPTTGRREQYLESIQQPNEIEVEILMRNSRTGNIVKHDSDLEWDEDGLCDRAIPKLDSEGCIILKKI